MDNNSIPKPNPLAGWIGSMKDEIKILGDIVSPASDEEDWEALQDSPEPIADLSS